jgi:hypothetical protein
MLDERSIEAILAGEASEEHLTLTAAIADMRRAAIGPVPAPSAALSNLFIHGFSTEKGDLPVTAASNVTGPEQAAGLPKWRVMSSKMKRYVAGLSIAGKLALGVGVAAAATTGAGGAGVLPGPLQHDFATTVGEFVPFNVPDPGASDRPSLGAAAQGDNNAGEPTTTAPKPPVTTEKPPVTTEKPPVTTEKPPVTTEKPPTTTAPATTVKTEPTTTVASTAPSTTVKPGETAVPTTLALQCAQNAAALSVTCSWTVTVPTDTLQYVLLRVGPDGNRVVMTTTDLSTHSFVDVHVDAGNTYHYMLLATAAQNTTLGHSNTVDVTIVAV